MNTYHRLPTEKSLATLAALKSAVAQNLERKRKLGQYAVFWEDGKVVFKYFDTPTNETQTERNLDKV